MKNPTFKEHTKSEVNAQYAKNSASNIHERSSLVCIQGSSSVGTASGGLSHDSSSRFGQQASSKKRIVSLYALKQHGQKPKRKKDENTMPNFKESST